jgi:2-keto-4-pentenoate hydratase
MEDGMEGRKFTNALNKGEIILSGAFTASQEAHKGDVFECVFSDLGSVKVEFN